MEEILALVQRQGSALTLSLAKPFLLPKNLLTPRYMSVRFLLV